MQRTTTHDFYFQIEWCILRRLVCICRMGGDGGSAVSRIDMVKTKGYGSAQSGSQGAMGYKPNGVRRIAEESIDLKNARKTRMSTCALTGEPLAKPIVACRAGYLFNKESVIRRLLGKKSISMPMEFGHISGLKDLIQVKWECVNGSPICPITRRELNDGVTRSQVMWPCGCVISEKALALNSQTKCLACETILESKTPLFPDQDISTTKRQTSVSRSDSIPPPLSDKKKRPSIPSTSSEIFKKLFHDSSRKTRDADAFGRGFSSKGVGI